jgi:hypothetical protein
MAYIIGNNQNGQNNNANSAPVTISSDQISNNQLASEEALILLRRMVKLLESNAVVDSANRQRMVVDTLPTLATVNTVSTVSNMAAIAGHGLQQFVDIARNAYANGIRSKLDFS